MRQSRGKRLDRVVQLLFLIIIVLWLYEADGVARLCLRWFGLELCQSGANCIELGPGTLIDIVLISEDIKVKLEIGRAHV